jgi:peptidoglycan hydrolase-like protein with peptidoglycan-binding domain
MYVIDIDDPETPLEDLPPVDMTVYPDELGEMPPPGWTDEAAAAAVVVSPSGPRAMSASAFSASQNGYAASANRAAIGVRTYAVPGRPDVKIPLRGDIAPLLLEFARWWNVAVERLVVPGCWGYAYRPIRGGSQISNHGSGTAEDLNAPKHPLGVRGTVPAGKRAAIKAKARALGLRWGGDYTGRVDEMHVEVNEPLARARQLVRALQTKPKPAPAPKPKPKPTGRPTLRRGSTGKHVRDLQAFLKRAYPAYARNLAVDGAFGLQTEAAVREFQRRSHLVVDGIVGPRTWAALGL